MFNREQVERAVALSAMGHDFMKWLGDRDREAVLVRTQPGIEIELPEHLRGVPDVLANGRIQDAVSVLERPEYETDGIAKLVLAHCLAFDRRVGDAIAMYDRAATVSPDLQLGAAIGKADLVASQNRGDLEAIEGRALALRQLGRGGEAEDALSRLYAASGGRSALRVGSVRR